MAGRGMYTSSCGGGGGDGSSSSMSVLINRQKGSCSSRTLDTPFLSGPSRSPFLGSRSIGSLDVHLANGCNRPFFRPFDHDENGDQNFDEYFHQPEKKRRLAVDQVQFLEKSFEVENKLEPETKIQLAKDLGLQPRQVAIWFQIRRARWKTKQLEKDYDALQISYNRLKADYDNLLEEKEKLKAEVLLLTGKLLLKEREDKSTELSAVNNTLSQEPPQKSVTESASEDEVSKVFIVVCKQEDMSSAKSDIFDSDSPHYADRVHSSLLEAGDSSYVFKPDQSDLSQDEDDNFSKNVLLPPYIFPNWEEADFSDPPTSSCDFGFPIEDHSCLLVLVLLMI